MTVLELIAALSNEGPDENARVVLRRLGILNFYSDREIQDQEIAQLRAAGTRLHGYLRNAEIVEEHTRNAALAAWARVAKL